jgi:hypothetical protein
MERIDYNIYQKRKTCKLAWLIILVSLIVFIPVKINNEVHLIVKHKHHGSWIEVLNEYTQRFYIDKSKYKKVVVSVSYLY